MPLSLNGILRYAPAVAGARSRYLQGQREGEADAREIAEQERQAERQKRLDTFAEYARRRELDNRDETIAAQNQRAADANAARLELQGVKDAAAAALKAKDNEIAWFKARGEIGPEGDKVPGGYRKLDRDSAEDRAAAKNAADLQREQIRAAAAAARLAAAQEKGLTQNQRNIERDRQHANFAGHPAVKEAQTLEGPIAQLEYELATPGSAMGDLELIYQFIKTLDARTGVRPSEEELVERARSLGGLVQQVIGKWVTGKKLTPDMRADMLNVLQTKKKAVQATIRPAQARAGELLRRMGMEADSSYVAPGVFGNELPETPEQRKARLTREMGARK